MNAGGRSEGLLSMSPSRLRGRVPQALAAKSDCEPKQGQRSEWTSKGCIKVTGRLSDSALGRGGKDAEETSILHNRGDDGRLQDWGGGGRPS